MPHLVPQFPINESVLLDRLSRNQKTYAWILTKQNQDDHSLLGDRFIPISVLYSMNQPDDYYTLRQLIEEIYKSDTSSADELFVVYYY